MPGLLTGFVEELRSVGIPVSMVEAIDAGRALEHVDLGSRTAVKAVLGATLVKNARHHAAFETAFEAYFSLSGAPVGSDEEAQLSERAAALVGAVAGVAGGGGGEPDDASDLVAALLSAIRAMRSPFLMPLAAILRPTASERFCRSVNGRASRILPLAS